MWLHTTTRQNHLPTITPRVVIAELRADGDQLGGLAPFTKADRSRYLQALVAAARSARK